MECAISIPQVHGGQSRDGCIYALIASDMHASDALYLSLIHKLFMRKMLFHMKMKSSLSDDPKLKRYHVVANRWPFKPNKQIFEHKMIDFLISFIMSLHSCRTALLLFTDTCLWTDIPKSIAYKSIQYGINHKEWQLKYTIVSNFELCYWTMLIVMGQQTLNKCVLQYGWKIYWLTIIIYV